jgi:hypothetical protein
MKTDRYDSKFHSTNDARQSGRAPLSGEPFDRWLAARKETRKKRREQAKTHSH